MNKSDKDKILSFLNSSTPFMLLLKNNGCHYCQALAQKIEGLEIRLFSIDTENEEEIASIFTEMVDGVPSIVYYNGKEILPIEEPEEPDPETWYSVQWIKDFYNKNTGGDK